MAREGKMASQGEVTIYQTEDGNTKIDVRFENETVWLPRQRGLVAGYLQV